VISLIIVDNGSIVCSDIRSARQHGTLSMLAKSTTQGVNLPVIK